MQIKYMYYVEVAVNSNLTVLESHKIAHNIHDLIERNLPIMHCMAHINPYIEK